MCKVSEFNPNTKDREPGNQFAEKMSDATCYLEKVNVIPLHHYKLFPARPPDLGSDSRSDLITRHQVTAV